MKLTKICPCCKQTFTTDKNARKYCRRKCAEYAQKALQNSLKKHLCQWCGHIFAAKRKRKFCSEDCRQHYLRQLGIMRQKIVKIPVKVTLVDADRQSKAEGITYGTYVKLHKLY